MINFFKFMLTLLTCFILAVHATASHDDPEDTPSAREYYQGQFKDPLAKSRIVSFHKIAETKVSAESDLSTCVTVKEQLLTLHYYESAFSMLAEDGHGGITQQGKYAQMLSKFCADKIGGIYSEIVGMHNRGEKLLTKDQALEIGNFLESHGNRASHHFYIYARDLK